MIPVLTFVSALLPSIASNTNKTPKTVPRATHQQEPPFHLKCNLLSNFLSRLAARRREMTLRQRRRRWFWVRTGRGRDSRFENPTEVHPNRLADSSSQSHHDRYHRKIKITSSHKTLTTNRARAKGTQDP